jgi:8-oxo-dGTP diphosphatase
VTGSRRVRVAAAVVFERGRVLITQRPPGDAMELQWEFPGGKIEAGETAEQALRREIREELGVDADPGELLAVRTHEYAHGLAVEIHFVRTRLSGAAFTPSPAVHAHRWVKPGDIDPDELLEADRPFLRTLAAEIRP